MVRLTLAVMIAVTGLVIAFTAISTPKTMQIAPKTKVACPPACVVRKETVRPFPWCPWCYESQSQVMAINFAAVPIPVPTPHKGVWYKKL